MSVVFSFDESQLISSSQDNTCIVWDVATRQALRSFAQHKGPVTSLAIITQPAQILDAALSIDLLPVLKKYPEQDEEIVLHLAPFLGDIEHNYQSESASVGEQALARQVEQLSRANQALYKAVAGTL